MPEADRHDTSSIYKKLTLPQLQKDVPQLNWHEYLQVSYCTVIVICKKKSKKNQFMQRNQLPLLFTDNSRCSSNSSTKRTSGQLCNAISNTNGKNSERN